MLLSFLALFLIIYNGIMIISIGLWVWQNPLVPWIAWLHNIARKYVIGILVAGAIGMYVAPSWMQPKIKSVQKVFHWKVWSVVFSCIIVVCFLGWLTNGRVWYDTRFYMGSYEWQYLAIIEYAVFFVLQLYVWSKKGMANHYFAWSLSFIGCYLASQTYELVWFYVGNFWTTIPFQLFQIGLYAGFLYAIKWKPRIIQLLPLLFLCFFWFLCFFYPNTAWYDKIYFWIPRVAPMPLLLSIPLVWKKR